MSSRHSGAAAAGPGPAAAAPMMTEPAAPQYRIDPRTLREVPEDRPAAEAWLSCGAGPAADRIAWLRILGRLEEAEAAARAAFAAAVEEARPGLPPDAVLPLAAVLPGIRLAQVLHWKGEVVPALRLLARTGETLFRATDGPGVLSARAFLHQHRGKVLLDAGHPGWALADFRLALRIRAGSGAPPDQLQSTAQAVNEALRRLE